MRSANPDKCIACTTCLVHCPVAEATPQFLGPRMIGPAYERFRRMGLAEDPSLHYCANCKNCDISCPQGVPVSTLNMRERLVQSEKKRPGFRDWMLAHGELEAKLLTLVPAWLKNGGMNNPLTRAILDRLGIARAATLPAFAGASVRERFRKLEQPDLPKKVALFPGCYIGVYDPEAGLDLVWLLNRAGFRVEVPEDFVCCGLPLMANGFGKDAAACGDKNLAVLRRLQDAGTPVLSACPSCVLMFRDDLPGLFPEVAARHGVDLRGLPADACSFLLDCAERGELRLDEAPAAPELRVIYHAPCHLRAQGGGLPGLALLRRLPGVTAVGADAGCCGQSGSYGFKKEKYAIGQQIGARLFERIRESGATLAASECGTCRVQITHGGGVPSLHPVSIVKRRLEGLPLS